MEEMKEVEQVIFTVGKDGAVIGETDHWWFSGDTDNERGGTSCLRLSRMFTRLCLNFKECLEDPEHDKARH